MEYVDEFAEWMTAFEPLSSIGDVFRGLFGLTSMYGVFRVVGDLFSYKTIRLSVGSFKMKRKDINVQNLTNVVSANFYDGGKVPDNIRKEIIEFTTPKIKEIKKNTNEKNTCFTVK